MAAARESVSACRKGEDRRCQAGKGAQEEDIPGPRMPLAYSTPDQMSNTRFESLSIASKYFSSPVPAGRHRALQAAEKGPGPISY